VFVHVQGGDFQSNQLIGFALWNALSLYQATKMMMMMIMMIVYHLNIREWPAFFE
jgi:hypothetical protein